MDFSSALISSFSINSNNFQASKMIVYMKGRFPFYGIPSPQRNTLSKEIYTEYGVPKGGIQVAKVLFSMPQRELHYVAQELLMKCKKQWTPSFIEDIEWFITTNSWWDTVDYIASNVVGEYFRKWPDQKEDIIRYWNASENIWLVRTSIIFQLKYKDEVDTQLLGDCILYQSHSKEFFIKKAIGWSLRQYSKYNHEWVRSFLSQHTLQPLSVKEASKYLS